MNMMKNGLLIWNLVLTVACGYLLFTQLGAGKKSITGKAIDPKESGNTKGAFRIAYFEMDSLAANFELVKELKAEMLKKEDAINAEMDRITKNFQSRFNFFQQQEASGSMTDEQRSSATAEIRTLDEQAKTRKQSLDAEYSDFVMRRQNEIKNKIETYLKEYNKSHDYAYIVSYEQGLFYYKDSAYNITADLVKGLNDFYKNKKN